ncbi:MAG TPA: MASE1 domain-containing protein [Candidatus Dormibacteraeota bacterium]
MRRGGNHPVRYVASLGTVAIAYWVAAKLSLNLALVHGQVTPIWPPTGIALVTFLVLGRRMVPAIFLAAFAVNLPLGPSPLGAAIIAGGNALAPLLASELLRRAGFHRQLDRMRDAVAIVLGALVGMTISATVGSSVLTLSGAVPMANFAPTWAVWWAGDAMGVLLVAPMLLSLIPRPGVRRLGWRGSAELTALLAGIGVVTYFLFQNQYRLEYLVLPLIAVAAWRFRLAGAAPAALIASVIAVWAAVNGEGPFASQTLLEKMVTLQAFNVCVSLASFLLASFVDARQQREEMSRLYDSASLAIAAKTDAIDVAAHELAPPVAVLTSYLAILYDGKLGPPPAKWTAILRVMSDKAWQIDRIINELVDAARIEAKTQKPNRSYLDLREAVRMAIERARPRLEVSGGRITTELAPEPVPVDADARQIGRILDNLINNSLTYTVRPARLKVNAAAEGDRAVIHVIDNGVGMSEAERARVFEPFRRSKDPAFSEVPGVGLGLYASRKLAEVNQGRLTVERTEPGLGSCFALDLPLARTKPVRPV